MRLKLKMDAGTGIQYVDKELESYSAHSLARGFTEYDSIVFSGGEMLEKVMVDGAIDSYFQSSLGQQDAIYVFKRYLNRWVLYAIETEKGVRVGILKGFKRGVFAAVFFFVLFGGIAVLGAIGGGGLGTFFLITCGILAFLSARAGHQMVSLLVNAAKIRHSRVLGLA